MPKSNFVLCLTLLISLGLSESDEPSLPQPQDLPVPPRREGSTAADGLLVDAEEPAAQECPACMWREHSKVLRLETIKSQILSKLRLKQAPNISREVANQLLPKAPPLQQLLDHQDFQGDASLQEDLMEEDEYHATTETVITMASEQQGRGYLKPQHALVEQGRGYLKPQHALVEQGCGYLKPQHAAVEQGGGYLKPQHAAVEQGSGYLKPQHAAVEQGSGYLKPKHAAVEQGSRYLKPKHAAVEQGCRYLKPQHAAVEQGSGYLKPQHALVEQGSGYLKPKHALVEQGCGYLKPQHALVEQGSGSLKPQHALVEQGCGYEPEPLVQVEGKPSCCFFKFNPKIMFTKVLKAQLWVYLRPLQKTSTVYLQILRLKPVTEEGSRHIRIRSLKIELNSRAGHWQSIDFKHVLQNWFKQPHTNWGIDINAFDEGGNDLAKLIFKGKISSETSRTSTGHNPPALHKEDYTPAQSSGKLKLKPTPWEAYRRRFHSWDVSKG
ncbi:Growth/differentiation factor 11 [Acipenser ruthenus]|uniref:Growth/differentiation factor 11 n=1 Tax=Acipenser ruthenus TaxID=7906 RepID=A0A662YMN5_ACIRT|nr:Growth/differentiation factor 11 [Acipenser ruthenus]